MFLALIAINPNPWASGIEIKHADEICVLHEGKIVERGNHNDLIKNDSTYKKLHDLQMF